MVSASIARNIVGIIGNVISFFLFASPIPTFVKIYKKGSVEEFKPDPYLATIMNCLLWVFYGLPFVTPDSTLVITINGLGVAIEVTYITVFLLYAQRRVRLYVIFWLSVELLFLGVLATCTVLLIHNHENRSRIVGGFCVAFGIIMYASPLTIMKKVIQTKSVKYMPFYLSLTNFLNGVIWVVYALIRFDLFILIGNGLGALLGAIQLILYAYYYSSTPKYEDDEKNTTDAELSGFGIQQSNGH